MFQKPQPNPHNQHLGRIGEDIAVSLLRTKGFRIVARNFHARYGEIDIIATDADTIVFVEVKTRINDTFGTPEEAVTHRKIHELVETANYYVSTHVKQAVSMRIDVVSICMDPLTMKPSSIRHIPNITQ